MDGGGPCGCRACTDSVGPRVVRPRGKKRTNAARATGDPYAEGAETAAAGRPGTGNPYPAGSRNALQWDVGWKDSADDETVEDDL